MGLWRIKYELRKRNVRVKITLLILFLLVLIFFFFPKEESKEKSTVEIPMRIINTSVVEKNRTYIVTIENDKFSVPYLQIKEGEKVKWVNPSGDVFELVIPSIPLKKNILPHHNFTFVFTSPGIFAVYNADNVNISMVIEVI